MWQSSFSSVKEFLLQIPLIKEEDMTAEKKIAQKRLTLLRLAEKGSVP